MSLANGACKALFPLSREGGRAANGGQAGRAGRAEGRSKERKVQPYPGRARLCPGRVSTGRIRYSARTTPFARPRQSAALPTESPGRIALPRDRVLGKRLESPPKRMPPYPAMSAKTRGTRAARSDGRISSWAPMRPAEKRMVSWSWAVSSMKVRKGVFMPMGEHPPWT